MKEDNGNSKPSRFKVYFSLTEYYRYFCSRLFSLDIRFYLKLMYNSEYATDKFTTVPRQNFATL